MNDNEQPSGIRAGKAFLTQNSDDPLAQQSLAKAKVRLRAFAEGLQAFDATHQAAMEQMEEVFAILHRLVKSVEFDPAEFANIQLEDLRNQQRQAFSELANVLAASQHEMKMNLAAHGFDPPEKLDDWGRLARLAEKEPGPMTLAEIYDWGITWAQREALRLKIARGETPIQAGNKPIIRADIRSATDASVHHDEHDPRIE